MFLLIQLKQTKTLIEKEKILLYNKQQRREFIMDEKVISCTIDSDTFEKFQIALKLRRETTEIVLQNFIESYIAESFSEVAAQFKGSSKRSKEISKNNTNYSESKSVYAKAVNRIPLWAKRINQINHKIIKAFFEIETEKSVVYLADLKTRCGNQDLYPKTYAKDFIGNFNQMKIDAPKSHGKVFEVNEEGVVVIWTEVKETLLEYKKYFQDS